MGEAGLKALSLLLPKMKEEHRPDFVIANGENISGGRGLTYRHYKKLSGLGVDAITLGNHWAGKKETSRYIAYAENLIRPLNVDYPGKGSIVFAANGTKIRVTSILGRSFIKEEASDPVEALDSLIAEDESDIHIVDFHGESSAEKAVYAHYLDGRVSAVIGTHTHVLTDDAISLPKGTAFLTDAGCTGIGGGVIGFEPNSCVERFIKKQGHIRQAWKGIFLSTGAILEFAGGSRYPTSVSTFKESIDVGAR